MITGETASRSPVPLSSLDEDARYAMFDDLQQHMPDVWEAMRRGHSDESVVVVPSASLERIVSTSGAVNQALEERSLFLLLLLRQPTLRMVYVTSMPVPETIIEYYLALLPGVIPSHARSRLAMVAVGDSSPVPLSTKLLERPSLLRAIREMIPNPRRSHLVAYNATERERDIALCLGVPMYGADPRLAPLGGKSGCRRIFRELGVPHPAGAEDLHTLDDVVAALVRLRAVRPGMGEAIVKLNDGVSGTGNAAVDLRGLPEQGSRHEAPAVRDRLLAMRMESPLMPLDGYTAALQRGGGIVEERLTGADLASPSVQMRVLPDRTVELLSTHDQLLGGQGGQSYLGCVFPADPGYSRLISEHAMRIGARLAELGALGRFAVDFVVTRDDAGSWVAHAIELNLRKGGTTHPFLTLQFLTDGAYDAASGEFRTPDGAPKHLVATDHLESPALRALRVSDLFDIVARHGLHFDQSRQTGVVFHMMTCLTELGRVGLTAVGDTPEQAWATYQRAEAVLVEQARLAGEEIRL